jgi:hypothetical protein
MLSKVLQLDTGRCLYRWDGGYSIGSDLISCRDAIQTLVEHALSLPNRIDIEEWLESLQGHVPDEDMKVVDRELSIRRRQRNARLWHFIVVKLKSRDFPVRGQIAPPPASSFRHDALEVQGQPYGRSQVEWVDGSQDAREAAATAGYTLLEPSAWYVYGPAYRMESNAAGKRKAAARYAEEVV